MVILCVFDLQASEQASLNHPSLWALLQFLFEILWLPSVMDCGLEVLHDELEMLELEPKQVMSKLQKLPMETSEALNKCKGLTEETKSFSYFHSHVLQDWAQLKKNARGLRLTTRRL